MDFEFTERRPAGRLGRYVESVWHARGQIPYAREKIAPTGSTVAGIVLGPPIQQTPSGGPPFLAHTGFLIGPPDERWDVVMLVRQKDLQTFVAFATDDAMQAALIHRTAAIEDSRLLPLVEVDRA